VVSAVAHAFASSQGNGHRRCARVSRKAIAMLAFAMSAIVKT